MAEDSLKAFRAHDWDADADWQAYLKRVEVPDGGSDALLKVKAKWFKREKAPDLDVAEAIGGSSGSASASAGQQQQARAAPPPQQQQQQQQARPPPAAGHGTGAGGAAWRAPDGDQTLFAINAGILLGTLVYVLPVLPLRLSQSAYRLVLLLCFASHMLQITKQYGTFAFNLASLQQWAARALPSNGFAYAVTALMFLSSPPNTLLLAPYVVLAVYGASGYLAANFSAHPLWRSHGQRVHTSLQANRTKALQLNAQLEISLGFYMIFLLFTPARRNFLVTFFVWQQLRQRYWAPESGPFHRATWAGLDQATKNIRQAAPALERGVEFVKKWFMSVPQHMGGPARG